MSPPLTTDRGVADERDIRKCWAGRTSPLGCCLGTRCRLDDGQTPWAEWERFQCMGEGRQLPPQVAGSRGGVGGLFGSDGDDPSVGDASYGTRLNGPDRILALVVVATSDVCARPVRGARLGQKPNVSFR